MKRIPIESSSINSIGYDIAEQILEIEFTRGTIYQYKNVPPEEVLGLIFAESIGSFFHKNIKYDYEYYEV